MMSLSLAVGPWNLSLELGKTQPEPESALETVTLSDGSEADLGELEGPQAVASYGFTHIVGEAGPMLIDPEDFPEGSVIRRADEAS